METRPYVPWDLINNFMVDVFKKYGVPEEMPGYAPMCFWRATEEA